MPWLPLLVLEHRCSLVAREGEADVAEGRRVVRYPDSQQLFVGNVPHDVDKADLKEFFERELRSLLSLGLPSPLIFLFLTYCVPGTS